MLANSSRMAGYSNYLKLMFSSGTGTAFQARIAAAGVVLEIEYHLALAVRPTSLACRRSLARAYEIRIDFTHFIRAAAVIGIERLAVIETPHFSRGHVCRCRYGTPTPRCSNSPMRRTGRLML